MWKIRTDNHRKKAVKTIILFTTAFLIVPHVLSILVDTDGSDYSNYINHRIGSKYRRVYKVKPFQRQHVHNGFKHKANKYENDAGEERSALKRNVLAEESTNNLTEIANSLEFKNQAEPRIFGLGRTHHYLYNITHDQGLDTIIYVPLLERLLNGVSSRVYAVYPGTIWCGMGNQAHDDSHVGFFSSTDRCCRDHDRCKDSIPPKVIKHGLRNPGFFTRSHCDCDRRFYRCLKFDNSLISKKIGMAYFNILRPQCFRREFPVLYCWIWMDGRCLNYVVDDTRGKSWQWFDNRPF